MCGEATYKAMLFFWHSLRRRISYILPVWGIHTHHGALLRGHPLLLFKSMHHRRSVCLEPSRRSSSTNIGLTAGKLEAAHDISE